MDGIVSRAFAKIAARWHRLWLCLYTAMIKRLVNKGYPYTSPKLSTLSGRCAAHGIMAVKAAKRGGFYKRGRLVVFPKEQSMRDTQERALER